MFLAELFDSPVQWKWKVPPTPSCEYASATFVVGDNPYHFSAHTLDQLELEDRVGPVLATQLPQSWEIEFALMSKGMFGAHSIQNTGNASFVFATIHQILQSFVSKVSPQCIIAGAEEPSRQKLYPRFLMKALPGWNIQRHDKIVIALRR